LPKIFSLSLGFFGIENENLARHVDDFSSEGKEMDEIMNFRVIPGFLTIIAL